MNDKLNSERVTDTMYRVLYTPEEVLKLGGGAPEDAVIVRGINVKMGYHPQRLKSEYENISEMINELPDEYFGEDGGSFLNLCKDKHGELWTGVHKLMDGLITLAIGVGLGELIDYGLPRHLIPGGFPMVKFYRKPKTNGGANG